MEETTQTTQTQKPKSGLWVTVLVLAVVIAGILAFWYCSEKEVVSPPPQKPVTEERITPEITEDDSLSAIEKDLEETEILDLQEEFQPIDQELNSL